MATVAKSVSIDMADLEYINLMEINLSQFVREKIKEQKKQQQANEKEQVKLFYEVQLQKEEAKAGIMYKFIQIKGLIEEYIKFKSEMTEGEK